MIKLLPFLLVAFLVSLPQGRAESDNRIRVEELKTQLPIGLLKMPLGTVVTVKCRSFLPTEEESRNKDAFWKRQVEITEIDGKALEPPVRIEWDTSSPLLKKPPVGTTIEAIGYESGSFHGIPDAAGKDLPLASGTPFAFHSGFVPMQEVRRPAN